MRRGESAVGAITGCAVLGGKVEIHIPISPNSNFFTMVHLFAASLRRNGGGFRGGQIIVSVGEDCEPFDIERAHPELRDYSIEWRWTDREQFRQYSYFATGMRRWSKPFQADYVLMADADTIVAGDISEAANVLTSPRSICGVIATWPPFMARGFGNVDPQRWAELFEFAGLGSPPLSYEYPGFGHLYSAAEGTRTAPPYYNFGFVLGTRDAMSAIADSFVSDYERAEHFMKTDLAAQAALTLSIVRNDIDHHALPMRYNFWNYPPYASAFRDDFGDVRVMHYLNASTFVKADDAASPEAIRAWLAANRHDDDPIKRALSQLLRTTMIDVEADYACLPPNSGG